MIKTMKSWSIIIVEGISYLIFKPTDLEMFSFGWAIVALVFLLYTFSSNSNAVTGFGFNDQTRYGAAVTAMVERQTEGYTPHRKSQNIIDNRWIYVIAIGLNALIFLTF